MAAEEPSAANQILLRHSGPILSDARRHVLSQHVRQRHDSISPFTFIRSPCLPLSLPFLGFSSRGMCRMLPREFSKHGSVDPFKWRNVEVKDDVILRQ